MTLSIMAQNVECHIFIVLLSVVMPSVVMLSFVAPYLVIHCNEDLGNIYFLSLISSAPSITILSVQCSHAERCIVDLIFIARLSVVMLNVAVSYSHLN